MDFGDYCLIEQKRYGCENEMFLYKVISGGLRGNYWREVPVDARNPDHARGEISDVILAIKCGVDETDVDIFRLEDVKPNTKFKTNSSINFNEDKCE